VLRLQHAITNPQMPPERRASRSARAWNRPVSKSFIVGFIAGSAIALFIVFYDGPLDTAARAQRLLGLLETAICETQPPLDNWRYKLAHTPQGPTEATLSRHEPRASAIRRREQAIGQALLDRSALVRLSP